MTADFGEDDEPHQHDKPESHQHVSLNDSGHKPRHLTVNTSSSFALTTGLESTLGIFSRGLTRVLLCPTVGETTFTAQPNCAFVCLRAVCEVLEGEDNRRKGKEGIRMQELR